MIDVHDPRYDCDGYVIAPFLDGPTVDDLAHDAERLTTLASAVSYPEADFVFHPDGHDLRPRRQGVQRTVARTATTRPVLRTVPAQRLSRRVAAAPVLHAVRRAIRYSPAAALVASDPQVIGATRYALGAPCVQLVRSVLWLTPPVVGSTRPALEIGGLATESASGRDRHVAVWIALDPTDGLSGCLRVIPGSHRYGCPPPKAPAGTLSFGKSGSRTPRRPRSLRSSPLVPSSWQGPLPVQWRAEVRDLPLQPGHAVVLHPRLLHSTGPMHIDRPSRVLILVYTDHPRRSS